MQWFMICNIPNCNQTSLTVWQIDNESDILSPSFEANSSAIGSVAFVTDGSKKYKKISDGSWVEECASTSTQGSLVFNFPEPDSTLDVSNDQPMSATLDEPTMNLLRQRATVQHVVCKKPQPDEGEIKILLTMQESVGEYGSVYLFEYDAIYDEDF